MSKKTEKALNEKMNVKLPENLSKDNILEQLENVQQNEKIVEMPKKKNVAKRLVPIAASFAVVFGVLTIFFGVGLGEKLKAEENIGDKTEVMRYQSYDKIYDKFDDLRKEYKKESYIYMFSDVFNGAIANDDAVAENMAGDMNAGASEDADSALPESSLEADGSTNSSTSTTNKAYGTTNRQESDVDEGDIIKTDGNYLYIVNAERNLISIVDVQGEEMKELSQIKLEDYEFCQELYISQDRLVMVGYSFDKEDEKISGKDYAFYGYSYYRYISGDDTLVKIYDISDRATPKQITEYTQQGEYDNSRMIGTKLYCISTYYVDVTADDYRDLCIPETEINGVCKKIDADCISVVEESESPTYAVITTLDVRNGTEPACEAVLGNCDELFASAKGLFLSETSYDNKTYKEFTKIYRFEYTDTGVNYKCMGRVDGYINDRFSMSYDGEYFRIATTLNKTEIFDADGDSSTADDTSISMTAGNTVNNLYILNNNMQIVGKVEDLAKGETIQSVRFVGNMAYVVTFRQTDPLFVIDLSDPTKPTVKGELKIPGFSEYLHPIADGLLVGVGQDGTETGTNGDCKVSLFDVSNPYEPKEISILRVTNGEGYCWTPVSSNHKAYITLSNNEFAVPFSIDRYVAGEGSFKGDYYIRYKLENGELYEITRYNLGDNSNSVMGATYVENIFYVVVDCYNSGTCVVSYDLVTNQEVGRIQLNKWE